MREPEEGDHITIRWPGGPHDFKVKFIGFGDQSAGAHAPGWVWLSGHPIDPHRWQPTFYAKQIGPSEFTMLPKKPWPPVKG